MLDLEKMKFIAFGMHTAAAAKQYGPSGSETLRLLFEILIRLYRKIDPALRTAPLVVFIRVPGNYPFSVSQTGACITEIAAPEHVTHELNLPCVVEVMPSGKLRILGHEGFDGTALSHHAIVYSLNGGLELLQIGGESYTLVNPAPGYASIFARPTFSSLEEALADYKMKNVRYATCFILREAWADPQRIFLCTKPEWIMRRSLQQFLATTFVDAEVRPESIVDESHPVDIKITWSETSKHALIEIKWLGRSRGADGKLATGYSASRALEGARQLAEYLDANHSSAPGLTSRGYLVVIDARRKGLKKSTTALSAKDGLHYRDAEITYKPKYHEIREDFSPPVRMFAEPVLDQ